MRFTAEQSSNGVVERDFTVEETPGVLWSRESTPGPLVLMGHGGGQHKKSPAMTGRARLLVAAGFTVATIDAPGHGPRPLTPTDERERAELSRTMAANEPVGPIVVRYNADIARRAVPEWQAVLDALQTLPEIRGPVGYFGLNMATAIGIPLVAKDRRIAAAVFGQFWSDPLTETARHIEIPIEFTMQWDDEHIPRESALALFDAFASKEKTLHANAGKHKELPRFEAASAVHFFTRHLS